MTTKEIFELAVRWKYHIQKYTLSLKKNDDIAPDVCITALIDAGYIHSSHLSKPGSYKKDGDTISMRTLFDEKIVSLSFFDTVIDEILLFDMNGQFIEKRDEYFFVHPNDDQAFSEEKTSDPESSDIFHFLRDTNIIFVDLDFWDPIESVSNLCQNPIVFSGNPKNKSISIGILELKISSLQELETLVKNSGNRVHFYTKHMKALKNFLEYNNLAFGLLEEVNIAGLESFATSDTFFVADDILGDIFIRNRTKKSISKKLDLLLEIHSTDYVVHRDH